jgi:hypothetical protein
MHPLPPAHPWRLSSLRTPTRGAAAALIALALLPGPAALAQVETFMNKPGSSVGPATKVVPTNCVQGPDGSLTCDTKLENSPSDTPAQPQYSPFKN